MSLNAWSKIPRARFLKEGSGFLVCGYRPSLSSADVLRSDFLPILKLRNGSTRKDCVLPLFVSFGYPFFFYAAPVLLYLGCSGRSESFDGKIFQIEWRIKTGGKII